jgi:RND superfamily putative drug exporter
MFDRYARFITRRARPALVVAGVLLAIAAVIGFGAFGKLQSGGFQDPAADSTKAQTRIDATFKSQPNLVLLVHAGRGTVDSPDAAAAGRTLTAELGRESGVDGVTSYWRTGASTLRSGDRTDALVLVHLTGSDSQVRDRTDALVTRYGGDRGAVTVTAGGPAGINRDVNAEVGRSLGIAEAIAVPITMLLLVLAFGSLVAALLPLAIGGVAVLGTFAELFVLGSVTDVAVYAVNMTTAMGLALGVDYALLMVGRFREQLAAGEAVPDAVHRTVVTAGRTILFSAATVATALAALLVFPEYFLRSFAYAGIGVVAIAALGALVIAPALLTVLGHRVNRGRLPWASRGIRSAESPFWQRIASGAMRRPVLAAVPVLAILLALASPLLGVTFGTPDQNVLRTTVASRQVADTLTARFGTNDSDAVDIVTTGPVAGADLARYATALSERAHVSHVATSLGVFSHGRRGPAATANPTLAGPDAQLITVSLTVDARSGTAEDLVRALRVADPPAGTTVLVGGTTAQTMDTEHSIGTRLPWAALLIVVTTFVLLFLFTGSVVQPLRALVLNGLSLSAALGAMTWIFQHGHLAGLLQVTPRPMDTSMTVLLSCIVFGLSMDYEVFLTSRIKELHDAGATPTDATAHGLGRTGRIITTAAGLLAVSFFAFGTSTVSFLQMFGLGTGLAILIDATLVRGILVPVAMRLLGRAAWYAPKPLRHLHTRVALAEA